MPYFIAQACIDVTDRSCVDVCPVDCIYLGERKLYINPVECIECGACEPACPVEAISMDDDAGELEQWLGDNERFFTDRLPGRDVPVGNPGGAATTGPIGTDTELVTGVARNG